VTRTANVFFKDNLAGSFVETAGGGTRFTYAEGWQANIACCLPVARREHEWPQGVHPFFQHLAPEGWLREQQARVAHLAEQDDFGLLLHYGADCIGAVGIGRPAEAPVEDLPEANELTASPGRTISGVQRKLLVVKEPDNDSFRPAGPTGPAPYIAKFNSERLATLVRNENLSLRWSTAVLGANEVNAFRIGRVNILNETALIVTRFDRTDNGSKLRLEDFAQILCKPRGRDFSGKYDASYEDVAEVIKKHSVRAEIDLARFFRRLIVFVLIGNCDAHLRNFSLLETTAGLRLSPAYDIVNTALYDGYDQDLALSIGGAKIHLDQVTREVLEDFGRSIALPKSAITDVFQSLSTRIKRAKAVITPPPAEPPDGFVTRFSEIVSRACLRIFGE
jgi:serine/threonine-protein kinase HipA